jgi:hypothetical protein
MASVPVEKALERIDMISKEGIEYFRKSLRICNPIILQNLKPLRADEEQSHQVAALLSGGVMIPLDERGIDILNRIIDQNVETFRAAFGKPGGTA